jgi:hypothetical protein
MQRAFPDDDALHGSKHCSVIITNFRKLIILELGFERINDKAFNLICRHTRMGAAFVLVALLQSPTYIVSVNEPMLLGGGRRHAIAGVIKEPSEQ